MKFNKKVPLVILIICLFLTVISVYQEHEKKALYGHAAPMITKNLWFV